MTYTILRIHGSLCHDGSTTELKSSREAELFRENRSQAVCSPADFELLGDRVWIRWETTHPYYATAEKIEYLSSSAAAQLIGVTRGHFSNAVLRGDIPSRIVLLGTRGKAYEVPKQDAERVAKERLNWLRVVEAAERAGGGRD